jgi:radical SAM superfamily enzyme YgiQ (UPF0313 family)
MNNPNLLQVIETSENCLAPGHVELPTVCFVTPLSLADFVDPDLTIKGSRYIMAGNVGILTLAARLTEQGYKVRVLNLDQLFLQFLGEGRAGASGITKDGGSDTAPADCTPVGAVGSPSPEAFFQFVLEHLKVLAFDIFGFGSICSSYPMTIRLARETKMLHPGVPIIVGGPQASVVDVPTIRSFPWIDYVVRGEADDTILALLKHLAAGESVDAIPGVTFRRGDEIVRNPNAPPIADLDRLPMPAFHLDPDFMSRGSVYLEIGRGCPFACTFCSTNDFFRRNFRLKSSEIMVQEMKQVKQEYGLGNFSLIHDMYTIDRKQVIAFCNALLACGEDFTWACSARTDCIDDELIALMAKAGCRGIFYGIETGSDRLQKVINKKLDLAEAWQRIEAADRNGIKIAVALITAFPEETRDDLRDTIHFFVDSSRFEYAEPQLSLLAPLAATPIYEKHKDELVLDEIFSDMSHQGWQQDPADAEMIGSYPDIFPNFYAVPTRSIPRSYFKEVRDFVTYVTTWFHWLPVALRQDSGDFLQVFDRWKNWLAAKDRPGGETDTGSVPYYCHRNFRGDFLEFVETCYLNELARAKAPIAALVRSEGMSHAEKTRAGSMPLVRVEGLENSAFPFQEENLLLMDVDVDYKDLVERLRTNRGFAEVREKRVTIVFRPRAERRVQVWQLSPLSATLIRLCDGTRTVEEITREFAGMQGGVCGVPAETVCLFGLALLQDEKLIGFARDPLVSEDTAAPGVGADAVKEQYSRPPQMSNTQQPWPWPANRTSEDAFAEVEMVRQ